MARFYGSVQGNRGEAHRLGHAKGGLHVKAQTWQHSITVELFVDSYGGDCVHILCDNHIIYDGPIAELAHPGSLIEKIAYNALAIQHVDLEEANG